MLQRTRIGRGARVRADWSVCHDHSLSFFLVGAIFLGASATGWVIIFAFKVTFTRCAFYVH
jgi:hypothetical protein